MKQLIIMGNTNGVPTEHKFYSSYCKQIDLDLTNEPIRESVALNFNENSNFIFSIIYSHINNLGYSIKLRKSDYHNFKTNSSIKEMIEIIKSRGFLSSDNTDVLSDLQINGMCYYPRNIKNLINKNRLLLAGIILDNDIMESIDYPDIPKEITDIICIVGYTPDNILIKTTWSNDKVLSIDNKFIDNIKEVWDIIVESPEPIEF